MKGLSSRAKRCPFIEYEAEGESDSAGGGSSDECGDGSGDEEARAADEKFIVADHESDSDEGGAAPVRVTRREKRLTRDDYRLILENAGLIDRIRRRRRRRAVPVVDSSESESAAVAPEPVTKADGFGPWQVEPQAALHAWPEEPRVGGVDGQPATMEGADGRPGTSRGSRPRVQGREATLKPPLPSAVGGVDKVETGRLSPAGVHFMETDPFYDAHSGSDSDSLRLVRFPPPPLPARPPVPPPPRARVSAPVAAKKLFGIFARAPASAKSTGPAEPSGKASLGRLPEALPALAEAACERRAAEAACERRAALWRHALTVPGAPRALLSPPLPTETRRSTEPPEARRVPEASAGRRPPESSTEPLQARRGGLGATREGAGMYLRADGTVYHRSAAGRVQERGSMRGD